MIVIKLYFNVGYYDFLYFLPIYLLGAYLGMHKQELVLSHISGYRKLNLGILAGLFVYLGSCTYFYKHIFSYEENFFFTVISFMILLLFIFLIKVDSFPAKLNGISMWIYCAHDVLIKIIRRIVLSLNCSMYTSWIFLIVTVSIVCVVSYCLAMRYAVL